MTMRTVTTVEDTGLSAGRSATSPAISARGLRMRYGTHEVVGGIDLEVHAGEVFAFLGPNGAGKTTTSCLPSWSRSGKSVSALSAEDTCRSVDARCPRQYHGAMSVPPQLETTRRSGRRPMTSRRKRGLARLFVLLALVVALIAGASLLAVARASHLDSASARSASRPSTAPVGSSAGSGIRPTPSPAASQGSTVSSGAAASQPVTDPALQARITAALRGDGLAGTTTAVYVYDLSAAHALYARNAHTDLLPASNEKLITSSAALARWGADYRFTTALYTTGMIDAHGVYRGPIYLKGYGDPSLSTVAYQRGVLHLKTSRLSDFVTALRREGVKRIEGSIVGDASYFDAARTVRVWKPGMSVNCGPLSALSLNEGVRSNGRRAADPPLYVATSLTALLRHGGIAVSGRPRVGTTPSIARLAYIERSAPLSAIVAVMNKSSDNFIAEMLTKGLGASFGAAGSTAAGVEVERAFLVSQGIGSQSFALTDGSGLSYSDRLTALDLTELLKAMAHSSDWPVLWKSLSVAGVDGTLAQRMRGGAAQGSLHGKTGTLTVASSLSGYVRSADGAWLAFSILMNRNPINVTAAHAAQDAIGVALARSRPPRGISWTPGTAASAAPAARSAAPSPGP